MTTGPRQTNDSLLTLDLWVLVVEGVFCSWVIGPIHLFGVNCRQYNRWVCMRKSFGLSVSRRDRLVGSGC
ncbi:MAG: hypothetical protein LC775_19150, partial [Acidobacteria bacterium]|nr:hypothetical protein [Acidobacteriota bacterium]